MAWLLVAGVVGSHRPPVRPQRAANCTPTTSATASAWLFLGLAIVFAAAIWARMHNLAGEGIYTLTSSVVGEGAFAIPVLFALVGVAVHAPPGPERGAARRPRSAGPRC